MTAWTKKEDRLLAKHYPEGAREAAEALPHRSRRSIVCRASRLSLRVAVDERDKQRWTEDEDLIICRFYRTFGSKFCQGGMPHRTRGSICARAAVIGVRRDQSLPACDANYDDWIEVERLALCVRWT